jgi:hypothetical protein
MRKSIVAATCAVALWAAQNGRAGVWLDEALPAGAGTSSTGGEPWTWVSANPTAYSGSLAHQSLTAAGLHGHSFNWASATLAVNTGDTLYTYVYLDPANPPAEIMLSWCTTAGEWEHRAYWGVNQISYGTDGTSSRKAMGALPSAGQWIRLEVPASAVGLEGKTLQGMDFALFNGHATWDYSGTASSGNSGGVTNGPVTTHSTNGAPDNLTEYDELALPAIGQSMLRVLSPSLLELHLINTEPAGGPVSSWAFVDSSGHGQLPSASEFAVTADGQPLAVQAVGFKRRPLYAPLAQRDLRIDSCLYLQLASPISGSATVTVANPDGTLWGSDVQYTVAVDPARYSPVIHVNQEGYVSSWPKKAMVGYYLGSLGEMNLPSSAFWVVDAKTGATQYTGALTLRADVGYNYTPTPYQKVYQADFSGLTTPGQYLLLVPGLGTSLPFRINDGVAMAFARAYELGLYHQRCGTSNAMPFTRFTHGACHTAPASVPVSQNGFAFTWNTIASYAVQTISDHPLQTAPRLTSPANQLFPFVNTGPIDTSGGHHDAGDYSKYTINCANLAHELMFEADSLAGVAALDNLGIPESGDGISDILQEAKWEADYLAKIQDSDGGFYFLVYPQNREYESNVTPDHGDPQVVWPKTTSVTAAAVAALAQCASSPLMKQAYPAAAALYLQKAQLGWQFLLNAINRYGKTGAYQKITHYGDDFGDADELAWAACEMFLATGDQTIHQTLKAWFPDPTDPATFRWGWWRLYACYGNAVRSYAFAARSGRLPANQLDAGYLAKCIATITNAGIDAATWSQQCAYGSSFPKPTKAVNGAGWYFSASQAFDIAVAYQLNPNPAYLDAMLANVNYEGGCNPVNVAYVTGLGWKRQRQIVDQYSWNDGRTMPPSGIPISSIQQGFIWTSTYGSDLDALTFPSDDASAAPYPFYDRWADTVNVTTEFVVTDQARGLGTVAFLAAMTSLKTQTWSPPAGQITGVGAQLGQNNGVTVSFQAPGLDLTDARILWEAPGQEPAFGTNYILTGNTDGTQWVEAEAQWPDGRRVVASTRFAVTNGLPNVSISSSDPVMTQGAPSDTATFTFTRNGSLDAPLDVTLQTDGTATAWNDYRRLQGDMPDGYTIPAGQSSVTVTVYAPSESNMQSAKTATLTLLSGANYNVGTPSSVNLTIQATSSSTPLASPSGGVALAIQKAASGGVTIIWPSTPGKTYSLAAASDLRAPVWVNVSPNVTATGSTASWTDASAASVPQRFYRVTSVD